MREFKKPRKLKWPKIRKMVLMLNTMAVLTTVKKKKKW